VIIYRIYFHPLSRFPGPKFWIVTRLTFVQSMLRGNNIRDVSRIHEKYGDIVRIAPNELSFARIGAWNDIFSHRPGHKEFHRNPIWWSRPPGQPSSFITASPVDHARMRRILAHAFSEKALREQEPILQKYVSLMVHRLREKAHSRHSGVVVNIVDWYRYCTVGSNSYASRLMLI
jgi:cytochrome P450